MTLLFENLWVGDDPEVLKKYGVETAVAFDLVFLEIAWGSEKGIWWVMFCLFNFALTLSNQEE